MSQITTGATLSKPIIRGLGFNRVITMHDGVRQEDNQWGEEHSLHIDEYSIDRYEIIRGAGSLMYGSDGIGGVMSVISILPPENTSLAETFYTIIRVIKDFMGYLALWHTTKMAYSGRRDLA
jgi:iron complex outermembrane receptor protein